MTTPSAEIVDISDNVRRPRLLTRLIGSYQWLASRELLSCCAILFLTLGIRVALLPWLPVPQPTIHDEFSYLLAADTYAHGRLTNPPQPFWQHFETFHVLQQPTYASKYQPLQGLVLAFGQKIFGLPWIGVYLSGGIMCASICWMLQGWISPNWALLGALLFMIRAGILSYWMNSYMGGAVPAIGGALALGAVARIWRKKTFGHSGTWGLGLAILVLSRPYDAAVLACATSALLLWFLLKSQTPVSLICVRVVLPALLILMICMVWVAYNDYRVTGHPLTLPYQAHERQYAVTSMFTMIPLSAEPEYHHRVMRQFYTVWHADEWRNARARPFFLLLTNAIMVNDIFFGYWALFLLVLAWPYDLKTPEERVTVLLLLVSVLMNAALIGAGPHYFASFAGVFYLRFLHSLGRLWSWHPKRKPVGHALAVFLVALVMGTFCINIFMLMRNGEASVPGRDLMSRYLAERTSRLGSARNSVIRTLEHQMGRHLILVRYLPDHDPLDEWVYNGAEIDASRIVWAREMSPEQDRPFIEYFRDRRVWLLEPDQSPPKLSRYPTGAQESP